MLDLIRRGILYYFSSLKILRFKTSIGLSDKVKKPKSVMKKQLEDTPHHLFFPFGILMDQSYDG
jgi:hypothetical protein